MNNQLLVSVMRLDWVKILPHCQRIEVKPLLNNSGICSTCTYLYSCILRPVQSTRSQVDDKKSTLFVVSLLWLSSFFFRIQFCCFFYLIVDHIYQSKKLNCGSFLYIGINYVSLNNIQPLQICIFDYLRSISYTIILSYLVSATCYLFTPFRLLQTIFTVPRQPDRFCLYKIISKCLNNYPIIDMEKRKRKVEQDRGAGPSSRQICRSSVKQMLC